MHCNRHDFVVWMSDLCSKCPLMGLHKIQTKEIKYRQFSPSPCLFAEPEAVSKHSVSLWIGYSEYMICNPRRDLSLQIIDTRMGFPCPSPDVVLDSIIPRRANFGYRSVSSGRNVYPTNLIRGEMLSFSGRGWSCKSIPDVNYYDFTER